MSAVAVEISLTLTSALVGIIITSEDLRLLSKPVSCLLWVDGVSPPQVINRAMGGRRKSAGPQYSRVSMCLQEAKPTDADRGPTRPAGAHLLLPKDSPPGPGTAGRGAAAVVSIRGAD